MEDELRRFKPEPIINSDRTIAFWMVPVRNANVPISQILEELRRELVNVPEPTVYDRVPEAIQEIIPSLKDL